MNHRIADVLNELERMTAELRMATDESDPAVQRLPGKLRGLAVTVEAVTVEAASEDA